MNMFLRLCRVVISALIGGHTLAFDGESKLNFRVWFTDQDAYVHMTNSKYVAIADLAVIDFLMRCGILRKIRKRGWTPVVVYKHFEIHRMVSFPQRYEVRTRMIGWTGSYVCMDHVFLLRGKHVAVTMMSIGRMAASKGAHPTAQDIIDTFDLDIHESPPLPQVAIDAIDRLETERARRKAERSSS